VCLAGALCPLSPTHAAPANQPAREIADLEKVYSQSFVTGDTRVAQLLVADDFVGVEPDGKTSDKPAILLDVKSTPRPTSLRIPALSVRLHDDTAIALGTEEDTYAGKKAVTRRRWLDTWKKTPDGWRLVSSAELLLPN
jgi:ketosteroid isomerase-like protein